MKRRSFLSAAIAAPWVVRSGVLMPVKQLIVPNGLLALADDFTQSADPGWLGWADVRVTVNADGSGAPSFQWFRDGRPIIGATGQSHVITMGDLLA